MMNMPLNLCKKLNILSILNVGSYHRILQTTFTDICLLVVIRSKEFDVVQNNKHYGNTNIYACVWLLSNFQV